MKKVKYVILILILMVAFCAQTELFQQECNHFFLGHYLSSVVNSFGEASQEVFWNDVYTYAKEHNVEVFSVNRKMRTLLQSDLFIYGDETVKCMLEEKSNACEGNAVSLMSGNTNIIYKDFLGLAEYENRYLNRIIYIGENENIYKLNKALNEKYDITFPEIMGATFEEVTYLVWGLVVAAMIIITCITVIYYKKEVVVRVCMGENVWNIVFREIFHEIIADIIIFVIAHGIVFHFLSGKYMKIQVTLIYIIGIVLSCFVYFFYGKYDFKKAFANINDTNDVLNIMSFLKLAISVVSIFAMIMCFEEISKNHIYEEQDELINTYEDYVNIKFIDSMKVSYENEREDYMLTVDECHQKIFTDYYEVAKPVICSLGLDEEEFQYIIANEYATGFVENFIHEGEIDNKNDVYVFIPEEYDNESTEENALFELSFMIKDISELKIKKVVYSDERYLSYIDTDSDNVLNMVKNPVLIYSRYSGVDNIDNVYGAYVHYNVLYNLSADVLNKIRQELRFDEYGRELVATNFKEHYEYKNNVIRRLLMLLTSLGLFCFVIQLIVLVLLNRLEYRKNSMEHAVKKIMGYNLIRNNYKIYLNTISYYAIITIGITVYVLIKKISINIDICFMVGGSMLLIELLIITLNIIYMDCTNVAKILKGGSL